MKTVQDIYNTIDRVAPFSSAMNFDNVGILVGSGEQAVSRVLISLDITDAVVQEAVALGAQLIVSHHPPIFHGLKSISASSVVASLLRENISALSCHTNLDMDMDFGVNRGLAETLGLQNFRSAGAPPVFLGELLDEMPLEKLAALVKAKLHTEKVMLTSGSKSIKTLAFCSGAGGEFIYDLPREADAFLTGEARHDEWIHAAHIGVPMIAAGHYETEKLFAPYLQAFLLSEHHDVKFVLSHDEKNPVISL